jgi:hypothetical protein
MVLDNLAVLCKQGINSDESALILPNLAIGMYQAVPLRGAGAGHSGLCLGRPGRAPGPTPQLPQISQAHPSGCTVTAGAVLPGSGSALLRSRPLRTVRARCRAHGSSKPHGGAG